MAFNAEQFLNNATKESFQTQMEVCPEGEYQALVSEVGFEEVTFKRGDRAGQTGYKMTINWLIADPAVEAQLGRQPKVRQDFFLDLTADGSLDSGKNKNITLGKVREALKQNAPGQPWAPTMMKGQFAVVRVKHRMDGDKIYAEIAATKAA